MSSVATKVKSTYKPKIAEIGGITIKNISLSNKEKKVLQINISPIFYMGNKRRLLNKGLIKLFPKDINCYYELFSGSAVVAQNIQAKKYVLSDRDIHLYALYNLFKEHTADEIISEIESRIGKYGLPRERTKRNVYTDTQKIAEYKQGYFKLRDEYNKTKNIFDFYTLMFFYSRSSLGLITQGVLICPLGMIVLQTLIKNI